MFLEHDSKNSKTSQVSSRKTNINCDGLNLNNKLSLIPRYETQGQPLLGNMNISAQFNDRKMISMFVKHLEEFLDDTALPYAKQFFKY